MVMAITSVLLILVGAWRARSAEGGFVLAIGILGLAFTLALQQ
jgi:hypothetical protein